MSAKVNRFYFCARRYYNGSQESSFSSTRNDERRPCKLRDVVREYCCKAFIVDYFTAGSDNSSEESDDDDTGNLLQFRASTALNLQTDTVITEFFEVKMVMLQMLVKRDGCRH